MAKQMDNPRRQIYQMLLALLQRQAGNEYKITIPAKERPRIVTKDMEDGSRLVVVLSWAYDAPRVASAQLIFEVDGEEMALDLPNELVRLVAGRERD